MLTKKKTLRKESKMVTCYRQTPEIIIFQCRTQINSDGQIIYDSIITNTRLHRDHYPCVQSYIFGATGWQGHLSWSIYAYINICVNYITGTYVKVWLHACVVQTVYAPPEAYTIGICAHGYTPLLVNRRFNSSPSLTTQHAQ